MRTIKILSVIPVLFVLFFGLSCSEEEEFTSDRSARLVFSSDTISFDTVFTSIGSATKRFQIFNKGKKGVVITSVRLGSGGSSGFRVNLDGQSGTQFTDVEIFHGDSIFCFVEVNVNPNDSDSPVFVSDSLLFTLSNGITQKVMLQAYGQDIIILRDLHISDEQTFGSPRPYVIYDSLTVEPEGTLTINPGVTLCFHSGSGLNVHGKLIAQGTCENPITLRGDRTDRLLSDLPYDLTAGTWGGIRFYPESKASRLAYCDIHGGSYGIICNGTSSLYVLNSVIDNVSGDALSLTDSKARIYGSQISNAGGRCASVIGGEAEFAHCTLAQFYKWTATQGSALYFSNIENDTIHPLHQLTFINSIITGRTKDEIYGTRLQDSDAEFNYLFEGCLVNTVLSEADSAFFIDCLLDTIGDKSKPDPKADPDEKTARPREGNFRDAISNDYSTSDFSLDTMSVARGLGIGFLTPKDCTTDMKGTKRPKNHPDAGCYQFVEEQKALPAKKAKAVKPNDLFGVNI